MRKFNRAIQIGASALALSVAAPAWCDEAPPVQAIALPAADQPLEEQFRDPPNSARPRVWWHWMNGNITKDGIAKDLDWMHRVGIGGLQNFDANLRTPQVVAHRLAYMTPEWQDAFRFAAREADRLGLELAIASSPGWSETGGPWVPPADGLKKVVWSETPMHGGQWLTAPLALPPQVTGPFQSLKIGASIEEMMTGVKSPPPPQFYADIAVMAVPVAAHGPSAAPKVSADGNPIDSSALADNDLASGITLPRGSAAAPATLIYDYGSAQTLRSATIFLDGAKSMFAGPLVAPKIEASDDGAHWHAVAPLPVAEVPTTISFKPVSARYFRLVLTPLAPAMANMNTPAPGIDPGLLAAMGGGAAKTWNLRQFVLSPEARIDQFETKAGYAIAMDYFGLGDPGDAANGPAAANVIDLSGKLRPDGSLDWTPPKGEWRVLRIGASLLGTTNHPATAEATGLEVDKFDGAAVRRYLEHYLAMYKAAAGPELIGAHGVRALLTDSIEVGAANWTPQMIAQFKRLRGYDPTPWLPALTGALIGSRAQSDKFLYDYRRTLADLMASEHYGTVAKVAHENGLRVYGEALEDKRPSLGDDMAMRSHTDIPMSAMWTHTRAAGPNPSYLADIKGAASVAHIYGQNLVAAESMTSALNYWADSPRTLKRVIDLEFATGVNRPVIHTSVHQPVDDKVPGLSLFIFGQYFNRHEAWAELARPWVDYIARNALMLQQGRNVADLGYFYGEEAPLTGLYGLKPVADAPVRHGYDFVNADALGSALVNDGNELVTPGGARYRALYLGGSSRAMTLATLQRLALLVERGATVIGHAPEADPALGDDSAAWSALVGKLWSGAPTTMVGRGKVIVSGNPEQALEAEGVAPDFAFTDGLPDADIPFVHRKLHDGESYFILNRRDRAERITAHFRVHGKVPELWHAETGTSEPVSYRIVGGETIVPLDLAPEESVHVVFRKPATDDGSVLIAPNVQTLATIDGPWQVAFQPGRGAPAQTTLPALTPLDQNAAPGIKYFSGIATYSKSFGLPKGYRPGAQLMLDLGTVRELAGVRVNGVSVGTAWHAPYRLDVGKALHKGQNRLEIRVANLWVNRLIGDAQSGVPAAEKITWTALPTYTATAPLQPSGLIGPVTLIGAR